MNNEGDVPAFMWPLLVLMAIAFTTVGGALVFGRSWMTIDRAQREVVKQWGLLVPLRGHSVPLEGYTVVLLGFVQGDSDSAESFPLSISRCVSVCARTRPCTATPHVRPMRGVR